LEVLAVIHQPIEIEQALIDNVLVHGPLVFEDDRAAVFVEPERIDPLAMCGRELGDWEADAEQRFEVLLEQALDRLFDRIPCAGEFVEVPLPMRKSLMSLIPPASRSMAAAGPRASARSASSRWRRVWWPVARLLSSRSHRRISISSSNLPPDPMGTIERPRGVCDL
jgi:hypothetical protein